MPTRLRNAVIFVLLAVSAAITWWLRPPGPPEDAITTTASAQRGYYMNEAVFAGLDEAGRVVYRLAAARIEGADDSSVLSLSDVEISYAQNLELPWLITAQSARSERDAEVLELYGVVIESTSDEPASRTRIEADDIQLDTDQQIARTSGPVRFAIGTNTIEAVGLTADLGGERIRLESGVYGRIAP